MKSVSSMHRSFSAGICVLLALLVTFQFEVLPFGRYAAPTLLAIFVFVLASYRLYLYPYLSSDGALSRVETNVIWALFLLVVFASNLHASASSLIYSVVKAFVAMILFYFGVFLSRDRHATERIVRYALCLSICFLSIELFFRLREVGFDVVSIILANFYLLKVTGIMFNDTNALGIYVFLLLVLYEVRGDAFKNCRFLSLVIFASLLFFLLFSFSRAAMASYVAYKLFLWFVRSRNRKSEVLLLLAVLLAISLLLAYWLPKFFQFVQSDSSGETKLAIFSSMFAIMHNLGAFELLFGLGFQDGPWLYSYEEGKFAHAVIPIILGSFGLIVLILYYLLFVVPIISYRSVRGAALFFGTFLLGLSFLPPLYEMLFFVFGLCIGVDKFQRGDRVAIAE